jgi:hypothetical protein
VSAEIVNVDSKLQDTQISMNWRKVEKLNQERNDLFGTIKRIKKAMERVEYAIDVIFEKE